MATIQIKVPNWLDKICAWPMMVYRRHKYGYDFRRIYLGDDEWTIVETVDYYRFGHLKWHLKGNRGKKFYAVRDAKTGHGRTKISSLHREIMNRPKGVLVDHKNCDSLDNRRANLRLATRAQNAQNTPKRENTSSRFIGVCYNKRYKKWYAFIGYEGGKRWLGSFDNEIDAACAYDTAARKYYGEFARLNSPD
ncbi:MAG: HNH endonuclease [Sedimentisphaerales bacterium]|nr:HNH endonuclease [Sedimentisphaerales bacterium]